MVDLRRRIPATDRLLRDPDIAAAFNTHGRTLVTEVIRSAQDQARAGLVSPDHLVAHVLAALPAPGRVRTVLNATGVLLHTNLGRAPLSAHAVRAVTDAAGTSDVELDLTTGRRGTRGARTIDALLAATSNAAAAHVVNNGAAALVLAATALAQDREIVLARGEMIEIGDGFRIPELLAATGARVREVGTANRVRLDDYRAALTEQTGFILKIHPSNFVVTGFTSSVSVRQLRTLPVPVVVDIGSGLLAPHPRLPDEPDATSTLSDGANLVTASGDKLLGGPQAGLLLGDRELVDRLRCHPIARALRADKLTLAGLAATVRGPEPPVRQALARRPVALLARAEHLAATLREHGLDVAVSSTEATIGGGGAPGVTFPSAGLLLPEKCARALRLGAPPVLGRVRRGQCVLDLFALPEEQDDVLLDAVRRLVR